MACDLRGSGVERGYRGTSGKEVGLLRVGVGASQPLSSIPTTVKALVAQAMHMSPPMADQAPSGLAPAPSAPS